MICDKTAAAFGAFYKGYKPKESFYYTPGLLGEPNYDEKSHPYLRGLSYRL